MGSQRPPLPATHLAAALAAGVLACACGESEPRGPQPSSRASANGDEVAVQVGAVALDRNTETPVVLLEEIAGERVLPIWIGFAEARSIAVELDPSSSLPRPNAHDLADHLVSGLEGRVARAVVTELRSGTFYALLFVAVDGRLIELDARPSDAIAIALRARAPLFVRGPVFEASAGHAALDEPSRHGELTL